MTAAGPTSPAGPVAIVQARMASTRLPGKVLADVRGRPLLAHVLERARAAVALSRVVVATTETPDDDVLEAFCRKQGIGCFRGAAEDVLDRYYQASLKWDAEVVVRLTADCPLLDPAVVDETVRKFLGGGFDYVSNAPGLSQDSPDLTYPNGLDTEVFSRSALERAWREAALKSEREHVTPYILNHPELFRIGGIRCETNLAHYRWTVDEERDLAFVRAVNEHLAPGQFSMEAVLNALRDHPEIVDINAAIPFNAGYVKSLREDASVERRR